MATTKDNHLTLILDDEPDIRELLQLTLTRMGIASLSASNLAEAYALLNNNQFDLCLTDMRLPDGSGMDMVHYIQSNFPSLPVAVITAFGNTQLAVESLKAGAFDFISKPVDLTKLREMVSTAIKLAESPPAKSHTEDILVGTSGAMQQIRSIIQKLARSQAPVFISGESGTGKEVVARQIHQLGPRCDKPFVPINCGAIPSELMESELFGHKKGSFTGANQDKTGLFEAANGGTLFLDEVAELPLHMQVKLLRAIQERAIRPVGEHKEKHVDVRILSASNKDIKALSEQNQFRQDLYFRLNVINLQLPPLRERHGDIEQLATHILKHLRCNPNNDYQLAHSAVSALENYPFPGNVRELENLLERAVTLCEGNTIQADDLLLTSSHKPVTDLTSDAPTPNDQQETGPYQARGNTPLEDHLARIEQYEIRQALEQTQWNRTQAAKLLGISLRQFRYKVTKYGLNK